MIGFQELVLNNKINVYTLANEMEIALQTIWRWFNVNRVPKKYFKFISEKFQVKKEYINKIVNDINTYQLKYKSFNDYEIRGDATAIFLENKKGLKLETLIDTEDLDRIKAMGLHWHLRYDLSTKQYYTRATGRKSEGQKPNYYLHMVILNHEFNKDDYYVVDHEDQNKLNNRKENLRLVPQNNNLQHRKGENSNSSTGVRNVNRSHDPNIL